MALFLNISCKQVINEPILQDENISLSIGSFDIQSITPSSHEILVKWSAATNAVRYDVFVNDSVGMYDVRNNTCLLIRLDPNTDYKIIIRAYDKNNFTKTVSKNTKTQTESLNQISSLPFGRYEYEQINITHCKVTKDNNYIILGDAIIYGKSYKIVLKTDKNFNIIWKYNYEGSFFDFMNRATRQDIKECEDGGFLIIARQFIFKISKDGNIIYQKKYIEKNSEPWIDNGIETLNGNFLFIGHNNMMLKSNSDTLWNKKNELTENINVIQNNQGNYFILGSKKTNEKYNVILQELDNSGNKLNENSFNVSDNCYSQFFLKSIDNGYYLISSSYVYYGGESAEMCVTKINSTGTEIWTLHSLSEINIAVTANDARVLDDNTLLCLCYNSGSQYYFVYEVSQDGKIKKSFKAGDMYVPIFVDKDENGRYVILTQGGYIYKLSNER